MRYDPDKCWNHPDNTQAYVEWEAGRIWKHPKNTLEGAYERALGFVYDHDPFAQLLSGTITDNLPPS